MVITAVLERQSRQQLYHDKICNYTKDLKVQKNSNALGLSGKSLHILLSLFYILLSSTPLYRRKWLNIRAFQMKMKNYIIFGNLVGQNAV